MHFLVIPSGQNGSVVSDIDDMQIAAERFDSYRERYVAGESLDTSALAEGLAPTQRARFDSLVDAFLNEAPRRPFNAQAFDGSRVADVVDRSLRRASPRRNLD